MPADDVLKTWSNPKVLSYTGDSWEWGYRCASKLADNETYFKCAILKDKASCDALDKKKANGSTK